MEQLESDGFCSGAEGSPPVLSHFSPLCALCPRFKACLNIKESHTNEYITGKQAVEKVALMEGSPVLEYRDKISRLQTHAWREARCLAAALRAARLGRRMRWDRGRLVSGEQGCTPAASWRLIQAAGEAGEARGHVLCSIWFATSGRALHATCMLLLVAQRPLRIRIAASSVSRGCQPYRTPCRPQSCVQPAAG